MGKHPPQWATGPHDDKLASVEVRPNEDGTIDEVCVADLSSFHLEQMDDDTYWIGLTIGDEMQHLMLTAKKGRLYVTVYT